MKSKADKIKEVSKEVGLQLIYEWVKTNRLSLTEFKLLLIVHRKTHK